MMAVAQLSRVRALHREAMQLSVDTEQLLRQSRAGVRITPDDLEHLLRGQRRVACGTAMMFNSTMDEAGDTRIEPEVGTRHEPCGLEMDLDWPPLSIDPPVPAPAPGAHARDHREHPYTSSRRPHFLGRSGGEYWLCAAVLVLGVAVLMRPTLHRLLVWFTGQGDEQ